MFDLSGAKNLRFQSALECVSSTVPSPKWRPEVKKASQKCGGASHHIGCDHLCEDIRAEQMTHNCFVKTAMQQLFYANELRSQKTLDIPEVEVKQQELDLATQLIDSISVDEWQPAQFTDEVQSRIREQIQRKVEGKEIVAPEAPNGQGGAQIIDLMEALRASLNKKTSAPAKASAPEAPVRETRKPAKRATQAEPVARKAARR